MNFLAVVCELNNTGLENTCYHRPADEEENLNLSHPIDDENVMNNQNHRKISLVIKFHMKVMKVWNSFTWENILKIKEVTWNRWDISWKRKERKIERENCATFLNHTNTTYTILGLQGIAYINLVRKTC